MLRKHIPVVVDEYLYIPDQMSSATKTVYVGSPDWYAWLAGGLHPSFSFKHAGGTFTARQERQRRGWYWYAYRKRSGQVLKTYLGRPEEMTPARLEHAAAILAHKEVNQLAHKRRTAPLSAQLQSILNEKFTVPSSAIASIERPRLLKRITEGVKGKLVLLSAAAGWGKTSLLSSWCTSKLAPDWPIAWVSLDDQDNEPREFWLQLLTALNISQTDKLADALSSVQNIQNLQDVQVLKLFLHACQQIETDSVLILDNYDRIQSSEIHKQLTLLLERLPARLHVIIASRTHPCFPLSRLRVQGALTELCHSSLRFTPEETARLLQNMAQTTVAPECSAAIASQTEGWIAGIQLCALYSKEHETRYPQQYTPVASNRYIIDYISEEILTRQSPELQQFMLQTSVLPRLEVAACNAIRQAEDSQYWLEQLRRLNLISVDTQEYSYCYPQLLKTVLYQQLQRSQPVQLTTLQQRAHDWSRQQEEDTYLPMQTRPSVSDTATPKRISLYETEDKPEKLTNRERDVLQLIINGASNRDIAQNLILSEGTVKSTSQTSVTNSRPESHPGHRVGQSPLAWPSCVTAAFMANTFHVSLFLDEIDESI
ncbi:helix-turn-helix transcriptional regulator [Dictyobacter vulcani]|nr:LuxR C-terminal-related transcriptional regulator [Dictyobacter vulcani]